MVIRIHLGSKIGLMVIRTHLGSKIGLMVIWTHLGSKPIWAETCSKDNTCLNKGHTDIVAYKGVFIYFLTVNLLNRRAVGLLVLFCHFTVCVYIIFRDIISRSPLAVPYINIDVTGIRLPLWSSGQSSWLQIRRPGFDSRHYQEKKSNGSGTGSTQPREYN
jgi:hypothetical protein